MLKMALLDCAINEKCCSIDGGRGICPLFVVPDLTAKESPTPGTWGACHPRQKNANVRVSAERGEGVRRLMHKLRNIFLLQLHNNLTV